MFDLFYQFFLPTAEELQQISLDWQMLCLVVGAFLIVLFSACFSASISEYRLRGVWIHFILGLALPVIYPLIIFTSMSIKQDKVQDEEEDPNNVIKGEGAPEVVYKGSGAPDAEIEFTGETEDLNQYYFQKIHRDDEGNRRGPFILDVDGDVIRAESIIEVTPGFIIIETLNSDDKRQRLRVPYDKIVNCTEG